MAATGTTGNNTHSAVVPAGRYNGQLAAQFVVEAVGATPTVTWKVQGSLDGTNWYDVLYVTDATNTAAATARTATAAGAQSQWVSQTTDRTYNQFRLVTSSNTNVTYRGELYTFENYG